MLGLDERVAGLEARMDCQVRAMLDFRADVGHRFDAVDRRFELVDRRFEAVDRRFDTLERKIDGFRTELDAKLSRGFTWMVGIQVAVLLAVIGALFGR
jgi:hypothetical protein